MHLNTLNMHAFNFLKTYFLIYFTRCMTLKWNLLIPVFACSKLCFVEMAACQSQHLCLFIHALNQSLISPSTDEKHAVQERTFTKWINMHLKRVSHIAFFLHRQSMYSPFSKLHNVVLIIHLALYHSIYHE